MITRRGFLKLGSGAAVSLFTPYLLPPDDEPPCLTNKARVATQLIYRYSQPSFRSERIGTLKRDQILDIHEEIVSPAGPAYNPRWYRLAEGFAHSGRLQRLDGAHFHGDTLESVPENGQLGEICVPFTQSHRKLRTSGWAPLYRLYYQSVHWITALDSGPDGRTWYRLTDDLLHAHHYVPTFHVRPVASGELSPISPQVPPGEKRIAVSIADQTMTAYEGDLEVYNCKVSTGIPSEPPPGMLPTETPRGRFYVQTKIPSRHMGDGNLTDELEAYELPGVPWVCFFHKDGFAFHGTYWHDNFGRMMSHGCVNLRTQDALWLYRWTTPVASAQDWFTREMGTRVDIA